MRGNYIISLPFYVKNLSLANFINPTWPSTWYNYLVHDTWTQMKNMKTTILFYVELRKIIRYFGCYWDIFVFFVNDALPFQIVTIKIQRHSLLNASVFDKRWWTVPTSNRYWVLFVKLQSIKLCNLIKMSTYDHHVIFWNVWIKMIWEGRSFHLQICCPVFGCRLKYNLDRKRSSASLDCKRWFCPQKGRFWDY